MKKENQSQMPNHKLQHQQKENTDKTNPAKKTVESGKPKEHIPDIQLQFSWMSGASSLDFPLAHQDMMSLQRTIGNRAVGRFIQAKLKIGQPNDEYEQEADRIAERVMCMPDPTIQRKPT